MEKAREELYRYVKEYGLLDSRTLAKSQELDKIIAEEIKRNGYKLFDR